MTAGAPTIGGLKRLSQYMGSQLKSAVAITGGTIAGVVLSTVTLKETVTAASSLANISANGVTTISSTGTIAYLIDAPVAGVKKYLTVTASTAARTVTTPANVTFDGTNNTATFNADKQTLALIGLSTSRYAIISNVGTVGMSLV